jgi:hypothetical protein
LILISKHAIFPVNDARKSGDFRQKPCTLSGDRVYTHNEKQLTFVEFTMPFGGKLSPGNRWVRLASMVPWACVEEEYQKSLSDSGQGAPSCSARLAFGALIIKERLG